MDKGQWILAAESVQTPVNMTKERMHARTAICGYFVRPGNSVFAKGVFSFDESLESLNSLKSLASLDNGRILLVFDSRDLCGSLNPPEHGHY